MNRIGFSRIEFKMNLPNKVYIKYSISPLVDRFERFEEWFKVGSRKKGAESENIFGNIEYRAIEPMLHCEQMHR